MDEATLKSRNYTGAFELFSKSKEIVMANMKLFAVLYALPLVITVLDTFGSKKAAEVTTTNDPNAYIETLSSNFNYGLAGLGLGVFLITVILSLIVELMATNAEFQTSGGSKPSLADIWSATKSNGWKLFGLFLLVGLMIVGIAILAGFVAGFVGAIAGGAGALIVIPLVLVALYLILQVVRKYFLAPYYLIDKNLDVSSAMKLSAKESSAVAGKIWGIIGVMILISFVGIIPLAGPFLSLILLALYSVAPALRYREMQGDNNPTPQVAESTNTPVI